MKKMKIGFGEGGFKGFIARHVEKVVLVVVILLMGWFIYSGSGVTSIDANSTPEAMKANVQTASANIRQPTWSTVAPERTPKVVKIPDREVVIDSSGFRHAIQWDPPLNPRLTPRSDPKIIGPENLVVTTIQGPLAIYFQGKEDEFAPDPLGKYTPVIGGDGTGGMSGYGLGGEMPMDTKSKEKPPRGRPMGAGPMGPMARGPMGRGPMGPGSGGTGAGAARPKRSSKEDDPYETMRGPMGPGMSTTGSSGRTTQRMVPAEATLGITGSTADSYVEPAIANVINASIPFAKQWEAYLEAFATTPGGQDGERDVPVYLGVWVWRAVVTDNPDAAADTLEWVRLPPKSLKAMEEKYADIDTNILEVADPDALDPKLVHPVPPFLLTNLMPAILHPDIPAAALTDELDPEMETDDANPVDDLGLTADEAGGSGTMSGGGGPGGRSTPRMGGSGGPRMGSASTMGRPSKGTSGRSPAMPRSGPGARSGGPIPGGMGGAGNSVDLSSFKAIAKKQVRYVDFDVKPSEKYRYRMQVVLQDPNRPLDPAQDPEITSLDNKSRERVRKLAADDQAAEAKSGRVTRTYYIASPLSKESDVASVPSTDRFFAGEALPQGSLAISDKVRVPAGEPQIKVLSVKWDDKLVANVPGEITAFRGTALNRTLDAEVVHPLQGDVRKVEKYPLKMDAVVLDIYGGEKLPGTDSKNPVRSPGEAIVIDRDGNFHVTDEANDVDGYRRFFFPEPKAEEATGPGASTGPGAMPTPGGPMDPYGPPSKRGREAKSSAGTKG